MNKIFLEVTGLSSTLSQNDAYALVLTDTKTSLSLPIIIGIPEAQSIALALENHNSNRPLTHDLFKNVVENYGIKVVEVVINRFKEGVFCSQLVCEKDGEVTVFDARTSDSVALALRFKCPIYTTQQVLDEAGIILEDDDEEDDNNNRDDYRSIEELKDMMEKAVEEEDYEYASKLRDEINSRGNR